MQAWATDARTGSAPGKSPSRRSNTEFVYPGDGRYEGLLVETDVTERVRERARATSRSWVSDARRTLADLDEPAVAVGVHCGAPHGCEFYAHCAPPTGQVSRARLGRPQREAVRAACTRVTAICATCRKRSSRTTLQRRIWRAVAARGKPYVGAELRGLVDSLPFPRYYLDFETVGPAVPIFAGTRPFEALPFQWSCHIETRRGAVEHAEFLDLGPEPPMRRLAESLLATLGTTGPILVYTPYERRVIDELAARYADLAARARGARPSASSTCTRRRAATTTIPRCRARGLSKPCCRP